MKIIEIEKELNLKGVLDILHLSMKNQFSYQKEHDGIRCIGPFYVNGRYSTLNEVKDFQDVFEFDVFAGNDKLDGTPFKIEYEGYDYSILDQVTLFLHFKVYGIKGDEVATQTCEESAYEYERTSDIYPTNNVCEEVNENFQSYSLQEEQYPVNDGYTDGKMIEKSYPVDESYPKEFKATNEEWPVDDMYQSEKMIEKSYPVDETYPKQNDIVQDTYPVDETYPKGKIATQEEWPVDEYARSDDAAKEYPVDESYPKGNRKTQEDWPVDEVDEYPYTLHATNDDTSNQVRNEVEDPIYENSIEDLENTKDTLEEMIDLSMMEELFEDKDNVVTSYSFVVIKEGDSYASIANRYHVEEEALRRSNNGKPLNPKNLLVLPYKKEK